MREPMATGLPSPYTMDEPPTSTGRVLLAHGFWEWCALHHGFSPRDIELAFDPKSEICSLDRRRMAFAARLLGELAGAGKLRGYSRQFGGGNPVPLPAHIWERDDFWSLFRNSALNLSKPYDDSAIPTYWIFFDIDDFNAIIQASCSDGVTSADTEAGQPSEISDWDGQISCIGASNHLRLREVARRTGMSRSTIYRRISQKRFPLRIPVAGNIAVWRESEVVEWLAKPR